MTYGIYFSARQGFSRKFGAQICKVILNSRLSAELDRSELDHVEPNQGLHHQSSCVDKRENRACLRLTDTICFFGLCLFSGNKAPNLFVPLESKGFTYCIVVGSIPDDVIGIFH